MTDPSDPQLHLKKKARRRLVGAVAIAGLAAVILPMVMDEEPKLPEQGIQIRIPGQDQAPFEPRELAAQSSPSASIPVAAAEEHDTAAPAGTASKQAATTLPEEPVDAGAGLAAKKAEEAAAAKRAEKLALKKAEKAVAPPARVENKPEAPAANGQYVIMVGAFANPDNVKKLVASIERAGVPSYTEILNSPAGKRTRVRAGPFANRDAAEKALDKLKRIGVGGVVAGRS
jgi:DedD protein